VEGYITVRLAIPKTVTATHAQVVHKSAGYYDSNIRHLVIQNKGTDNAYISAEVSHFSEFDIRFTYSKVSSGSSDGSGGHVGSRCLKGSHRRNMGEGCRRTGGINSRTHTSPAN